MVKTVDHKSFRLYIYIYPVLKDDEPTTSIIGTSPYSVYYELAKRGEERRRGP